MSWFMIYLNMQPSIDEVILKNASACFFSYSFTFYFRALNVALKSITTYNYFFPVKAIFYTLHHSLRLASKVR